MSVQGEIGWQAVKRNELIDDSGMTNEASEAAHESISVLLPSLNKVIRPLELSNDQPLILMTHKKVEKFSFFFQVVSKTL